MLLKTVVHTDMCMMIKSLDVVKSLVCIMCAYSFDIAPVICLHSDSLRAGNLLSPSNSIGRQYVSTWHPCTQIAISTPLPD